MNKYLPWVLVLFLTASSAGAQPVVDIRFTNNDSARYLERTGRRTSGSGHYVL